MVFISKTASVFDYYPIKVLFKRLNLDAIRLVGIAGFEPATSPTPRVRATELRHIPKTSNYRKLYMIVILIASHFRYSDINMGRINPKVFNMNN